MKAVFDREALLDALQSAFMVIPRKTPKVILQNIKLSVSKNGAEVKATDMESVGLTLEVRGVQVEEPGDILLPERAATILRECSASEVKIEGDEDGVRITAMFAEFDLPGEDADKYPTVQGFDAEKYHSIPSGRLSEMIERTIFSVATESARYALTGIMWELNGDKVRLVATDGKGLATVDGKAECHGGHATSGTPVVPTKVMQLLAKSLGDKDEPVLVSFRSNDVVFKTPRSQIYGRLVEGRYPSYREVFPKKTCCKIPMTVGPLTAICRQASILTDEDTRGVEFSFAKGTLTLGSRSQAKGKSKVQMPVAFGGKKLVADFDPKYVLSYLRVLEQDVEVTLELVENNTVSLWTAPGESSFILVPLHRDGHRGADE